MVGLSELVIGITFNKACSASWNCTGKCTVKIKSRMRLQSLDTLKFLAALLASNRRMGGGTASSTLKVQNVERLDLAIQRSLA
jgi:hypothetical protein